MARVLTREPQAVFTLTPSGTLNNLFTQPLSYDVFGLTLATDGNFYGSVGDFTAGESQFGILFRLSPEGTYTQLASFTGTTLGGLYPDGPPIQASDGDFYGTANYNFNGAAVYRYTPSSGKLTALYQFGVAQGSSIGGLFQATDGNLYVTATEGGEFGNGSILKMLTSGAPATIYSFPNSQKGGALPSGMLEGSDGNLYGTTSYSGGDGEFYVGAGTFFKMDSQGVVTVLYDFTGSFDGEYPGGLVQGTDGNFYGATIYGGPYGGGTLFQATTTGKVTPLYYFSQAGGEYPVGVALQHTNGLFYGALQAGGPYSDGAVYSLNMGLPAFITFVSPTGAVGQTAEILGQGFTGTTSVTFHGVPATSFTIDSDTYLTAVVPSGAATGKVVVTTPSGMLTSNVKFRIGR